ncbi:MAG: threonine--tRNA ligase, partial [Gammaproteobacteria bacterium]|nr:threonine--tRNA ligase [Gammaproteobacteria bacterium]
SDYAREVVETLGSQGFRVEADLRNEKIGFKIREHSMQRVPYLAIIGEKEMVSRTISLRSQKGEDLGSFGLEDLTRRLAEEAEARAVTH